jgi:hypothetical protein
MQDNDWAPSSKPRIENITLRAVNLRRIDKGGVLASFDLWFVELGLKLYGWLWGRCPDGQEWIMPPARDWTDKNGATRHAKILGFTNDRAERNFKERALAAVRELAAGLSK